MSLTRALVAVATLVCSMCLPQVRAQQVDCAQLGDAIHHRVNPTTGANLLTPWRNEAENAETTYGFSDNRGTPIRASRQPVAGLSAVHRLYKGGVSFLQSMHSTSNPVRIVEVDTAADEVSSWIYAPHTQAQYPQYDAVVGGLDFVD